MSRNQRRSLLARARDILFTPRDESPRSPRVVFDEVLAEKTARYEALKSAVASVLYLRNRLEGELRERRAEIGRLHGELLSAVRAGDEPWALELAEKKQVLHDEVARLERDLDEVRAEVREGKETLARRHGELRALEREKLRIASTLASTKAKVELEAALGELRSDGRGALDAELELVREQIAKLSMERALDRELSGESLPATSPTLAGESAHAEVRRLRELMSTGRSLAVVNDA